MGCQKIADAILLVFCASGGPGFQHRIQCIFGGCMRDIQVRSLAVQERLNIPQYIRAIELQRSVYRCLHIRAEGFFIQIACPARNIVHFQCAIQRLFYFFRSGLKRLDSFPQILGIRRILFRDGRCCHLFQPAEQSKKCPPCLRTGFGPIFFQCLFRLANGAPLRRLLQKCLGARSGMRKRSLSLKLGLLGRGGRAGRRSRIFNNARRQGRETGGIVNGIHDEFF